MRQRLIAAFIGMAIAVVALYALPRAFVVKDLIRGQEQHRLDDTAALIAHIIDDRRSPITSSALDALNADYEWIVVHQGGRSIATTGSQQGAHRTDFSNDLRASRALAGGGSVTVGLSEPVVSSAISDALVPLILLGLGIIALAGVAGYLLARRFSKPLQQLADAATGLGNGDLRPHLPRYRMPELRAIGSALTSSGAQIESMLTHEQRVAVHASHELRTPIAALRLELEDLALWPETPPSVATQLQQSIGELDRLTGAVGDLLTLARDRRDQAQTEVDLEVLVEDALRGLPRALEASSASATRTAIVHERHGLLRVRLDPVAVTRLVQLLVRTVLTVAAERVVVFSREREAQVEVWARPEGATTGAPQIAPGDLELAAAVGGQITRDADSLILRLPRQAATRP